MDEPKPPSKGRLIIIEPYAPEGQFERDVRAVEPNVGYEPTWIFESAEPLGWNGAVTSRLLLRPRYGAWGDRLDRLPDTIIVNECLHFEDGREEYCGLIGEYHPKVSP